MSFRLVLTLELSKQTEKLLRKQGRMLQDLYRFLPFAQIGKSQKTRYQKQWSRLLQKMMSRTGRLLTRAEKRAQSYHLYKSAKLHQKLCQEGRR